MWLKNINKSLFESGEKASIPTSILMDMIRLYSFDVDFQRDIRKNDNYTILYEIFYNQVFYFLSLQVLMLIYVACKQIHEHFQKKRI